ncbi:recombinase RecT [Kaistia soli]|nr:recombinase RecT [Kaistia soli]
MLLPQTFGDVVAFADLMSRSQHAIPKHLRGNPGACMAVTMQALRWEMDPFAVAAKAYSVNDMIAYEAQLIAAVVYTRAPIKRRPDYAFSGAGADLVCTVTCEMLDGSVKVYVSPREGDIKTKNSPLWKTDPQQQLGYYSIRSWARRYTPEVLLGVYAPDELEEYRADRARDVTPSNMAERLAATKGEGGFSSARVETEIAAAVTGSKTNTEAPTSPGADQATAPAATSPATGKESDQEAPEAGASGAGQDRDSKSTAATQPNLSEPPTGEDGRAEREPSAAPMASLSADDRAFLGRFATALRPGQSPKDLLALREKFGKENPGRRYAENTPGHAAVQAIYAIETKRVVGEMSVEDADARIEGLLT